MHQIYVRQTFHFPIVLLSLGEKETLGEFLTGLLFLVLHKQTKVLHPHLNVPNLPQTAWKIKRVRKSIISLMCYTFLNV